MIKSQPLQNNFLFHISWLFNVLIIPLLCALILSGMAEEIRRIRMLESLSHRLYDLQLHEEITDVTLQFANGETLVGHKNVLVLHSGFFRRLFLQGQPQQVNLVLITHVCRPMIVLFTFGTTLFSKSFLFSLLMPIKFIKKNTFFAKSNPCIARAYILKFQHAWFA